MKVLLVLIALCASSSAIAAPGPGAPPPNPQFSPQPRDQANRQGPQRERSPRGDNAPPPAGTGLIDLIGYMSAWGMANGSDWDTPVTGFGNDALWEKPKPATP